MKVVINVCFGGFSVSLAAARHMAAAGSERARAEVAEYEKELEAFKYYITHGAMPKGSDAHGFRESSFDICVRYNTLPTFHGYGYVTGMDGAYERADPLLVSAVEQLGKKAGGEYAELRIVEIPDGIEYEIDEYKGNETIHEAHRTWR